MNILITIKVAPGREDEVPVTLEARAAELIMTAFQELIDEGVIDVVSETVYDKEDEQ